MQLHVSNVPDYGTFGQAQSPAAELLAAGCCVVVCREEKTEVMGDFLQKLNRLALDTCSGPTRWTRPTVLFLIVCGGCGNQGNFRTLAGDRPTTACLP